MALSDARARNAKPNSKSVRLYDEKGLYLEVSPAGGKWWRLKYRIDGREKRISLGVYPDVPLKEARERRDTARQQLAKGIDPSAARKSGATADTFEAVAREWFGKFSPTWSAGHTSRVLGRLEHDVLPWLGRAKVNAIEPPDVLATLRRVEARGAIETAHRVKQYCSAVFRYAVATGRASRDPTADLRGALPPAKSKGHATITNPNEIGHLLRAIDGYAGSFVTRCALKLAPLLFVRPGELRHAEWEEFDLDGAEWRIPGEKMKMSSPHIVPLARQSLEVVRDLKPLTGSGKYVFPGVRSRQRPMSENTVNAALRRLGYTKEQMTGHGFRAMASTILNEQGCWHRDAIERQLAHAERDSVRAAYNYAEHLPERRRMMQAWADFLGEVRAG